MKDKRDDVDRGEGQVRVEAETGVLQPPPRECLDPQKLGEARSRIAPELLDSGQPWQLLCFSLLAFRIVTE